MRGFLILSAILAALLGGLFVAADAHAHTTAIVWVQL